MSKRKFSLSLFSTAALALSAAFSGLPAHAVPVTLSPFAGSTASANAVPGTPDVSVTPVFAGSSTSANAWDVGDGWSIGWASQYGAYAVRSAAEGIAAATSFARLSYSITNSAAAAMNYSLYFKIYGGSIGNDLAPDVPLTGNEFLSSGYGASIKVNGAVRFNSATSIQNTASGIVVNRSGVDLSRGADGGRPADDGLDGFYDWSTDFYRVDLGVLGAGQSVSVVAELSSSAAARVGSYTFDCGQPEDPQSCLAYKGGASAFYGDPNDFFGSATAGRGDEQIRLVATAVPEPGNFVLAGAGLLTLVVSRRRSSRSLGRSQ
jgi:hypothetical protein